MFTEPTVFILGAGASWHYGYPTGEELVKRVIEKARFLSGNLENLRDNTNFWGHSLDKLRYKKSLPYFVYNKFEKSGWRSIHDEMNELIAESTALWQRLSQTNAPVIDYFLEWNPELAEIGKLIIAWVLLECETHYNHHSIANINRNCNLNRETYIDETTGIPIKQYADSRRHMGKDDWYRFILYKMVSGYKNGTLHDNNAVTFVTFNYDVSLELSLFQGLREMSFLQKGAIENGAVPDNTI